MAGGFHFNGPAGGGSFPQSPHGWQRPSRRKASQPPIMAPCRRTASIAYWEQLGVKRHRADGPKTAGNTGESAAW